MKRVPQQTLTNSFQLLSHTLLTLFLKLSRAKSRNASRCPVNNPREGHLHGEAEGLQRCPGSRGPWEGWGPLPMFPCPRAPALGCVILVFCSFAPTESEGTGEVQELAVNPRGMILPIACGLTFKAWLSRLALTADVSYKPMPGAALFFQSNLLLFCLIELSGWSCYSL